MLDLKSLDVLNSLKSEIQASKEVFNGTVKGTGKSFGFVVAEDGAETFLAPDEMSKVFPGDKVTFIIEEQADNKTKAILESLVETKLKDFVGTYVSRGKAQGIEPFQANFSGWLFVPPSQINGAQSKQIVRAQVIRHPWETGKAQAKVIDVIGDSDNNRTWYAMALLEHNLSMNFTDEEVEHAQALAASLQTSELNYPDRTDIPFITIDSESTQDMDDALYAQVTDSGWRLEVAIADASAFLPSDSIINDRAKAQLSSCYLPGMTLPMVPSCLANDAMSLKENEVRPALVFSMNISSDGIASEFSVEACLVKSHAKLSYNQVSTWLETEDLPDASYDLEALYNCTQAISQWRRTQANPMIDRPDYRIRVDDQLNVTHIEKETRNIARTIVEEAMVLTNHLCAAWFDQSSALFMTHAGFKGDRASELKGLLRDYCPSVAELDPTALDDFCTIIREAHQVEDFPLPTLLTKRFDRGMWQLERSPHFGLGLSAYTTVTSPIRKYTDLVMHRLIKLKLAGKETNIPADLIAYLNDNNNVTRNIANAVEKRLGQQWLAKQPNQEWLVRVNHITANGLVAQIIDNGVTGFIDLKHSGEKYSYDPLRMTLKNEETQFKLNDELLVTVAKIDEQGIMFKPV